MAVATDIAVVVEAQRFESSAIAVGPGCAVGYRVVAELSDGANQGLAAIVFDLELGGGELSPGEAPADLPMAAFAPPSGLSNPGGYGGTPQGGRLLQVGGAQNVLLHGRWSCETDGDCPGGSSCDAGVCAAIPGLPMGEVVPDVAGPGSPVVVVTGSFTAPTVPGTYGLDLTNLRADVIEQGSNGRRYWPTEAAGVGAIVGLSVTVEEGASCAAGPGACCHDHGTCVVAVPEECISLWQGTSLGSGSACEGDLDGDGADGACDDACADDPTKTDPGLCGCGVAESDADADGDGILDCVDRCPGEDDLTDLDGDDVADCLESEEIPALSRQGLALLVLLLATIAVALLRRRGRRAR